MKALAYILELHFDKHSFDGLNNAAKTVALTNIY
jgi:hypothetical protein